MFQIELANKESYKTSIGELSLRLAELQELDAHSQKIREKRLKKSWKDVNGILYHQGLPYIL